MNEIFEILRRNSFVINRVILNNFTVLYKSLNIEIDITSEKYGNKKIFFEDVSRININSEYYGCSPTSSIIIEDVTELQWEDVWNKVMISEDVMTFYCKEIYVN